MAKVKIFGRPKLEKALKKKVNGFLKSKDDMDKVNKVLVNEMKRELADPDTQTKSLDSKTIARRKKLAKVNKTSKYYSASVGNITFTGKLVSKLTGIFKGNGLFEFNYKGTHPPYKLVKGGRTRSVKNSTIARGLQDKGWKVFLLPRDKAPRRILNLLKRYIRRNKKL